MFVNNIPHFYKTLPYWIERKSYHYKIQKWNSQNTGIGKTTITHGHMYQSYVTEEQCEILMYFLHNFVSLSLKRCFITLGEVVADRKQSLPGSSQNQKEKFPIWMTEVRTGSVGIEEVTLSLLQDRGFQPMCCKSFQNLQYLTISQRH